MAYIMCKHDVISINRYYASSETSLGKSGPCRAAMAQVRGFPPEADQVSGVRELRC